MNTRKVVAVTGAAGGVGAQVCLDLAADGHFVWCLDRDAEALRRSLAHLFDTGDGELLALDVTDEAAVKAAFDTIGERSGGRLDGLVNCAGMVVAGRFEDQGADDWLRTYQVNVVGTYLPLKHAVPLLRRAGPGRVVNLASIGGKLPSVYIAPYNASKAAVISLTRSAALSLAPDILVNCVCPGPLDTRMYAQLDERLDHLGAPAELRFRNRSLTSALGRAGSVAEVSSAIRFLLSEAAGFITGEDLNVNGGMVMH